jgi:hypothetical protein
MQHALKPAARAARAQIIAPELLAQLDIATDQPPSNAEAIAWQHAYSKIVLLNRCLGAS